jgi:hypothetical protein
VVRVFVLDGMGVIYSAGDDVRDLLCPFVAEKGGTVDAAKVGQIYREASLGQISSVEFWKGVGLDPRLEDEYLHRHHVTTGVVEFLETRCQFAPEFCCEVAHVLCGNSADVLADAGGLYIIRKYTHLNFRLS